MKIKLIALFLSVILIATVVLLLIERKKTEVLPIGSNIPQLNLFTKNRKDTIKSNSINKLMVVFFSMDCSHCEYMLNLLEMNIDKLYIAKIYLITTEVDYMEIINKQVHDKLFKAKNVTLGIANKEERIAKYGTMIMPSLYFFNEKGKLTAKFKGEAKYERIYEELNKTFLSLDKITETQ